MLISGKGPHTQRAIYYKLNTNKSCMSNLPGSLQLTMTVVEMSNSRSDFED